jgi:hypothetical protein
MQSSNTFSISDTPLNFDCPLTMNSKANVDISSSPSFIAIQSDSSSCFSPETDASDCSSPVDERDNSQILENNNVEANKNIWTRKRASSHFKGSFSKDIPISCFSTPSFQTNIKKLYSNFDSDDHEYKKKDSLKISLPKTRFLFSPISTSDMQSPRQSPTVSLQNNFIACLSLENKDIDTDNEHSITKKMKLLRPNARRLCLN